MKMRKNSDRPSTTNFSLVPVSNSQVSGSTTNTSENQPASSSNVNPNLSSENVRQPKNLQDLLKISTRLQSNSNEDPPEQLTNERAEFLRNALNTMTTDLVPLMQKSLDVLKETQTKPESLVDANLSRYEDTLEQLVEFLYEIDRAKTFCQIHGLNTIAPLLRSKHASLRSSTAAIILECCKNNPFCQELSVTDEIFGPLMEIANSDKNEDAMLKAIAAISAITRSNPSGISQFKKYRGIEMVEKALTKGCEKIVNRAIFLVMALCDTDEASKHDLTESGIVATLISLLQHSDFIVQEYTLRALLSITKENPTAQEICHQHDLQTYLGVLRQTSTDPKYQDLVECAENLLNQL